VSDDVTNQSTTVPTPRKKPYTTPKLTVYGSLSVITKSVGKTSNPDGGGGTMMNSQP